MGGVPQRAEDLRLPDSAYMPVATSTLAAKKASLTSSCAPSQQWTSFLPFLRSFEVSGGRGRLPGGGGWEAVGRISVGAVAVWRLGGNGFDPRLVDRRTGGWTLGWRVRTSWQVGADGRGGQRTPLSRGPPSRKNRMLLTKDRFAASRRRARRPGGAPLVRAGSPRARLRLAAKRLGRPPLAYDERAREKSLPWTGRR